jgi:hypothetical protein
MPGVSVTVLETRRSYRPLVNDVLMDMANPQDTPRGSDHYPNMINDGSGTLLRTPIHQSSLQF